MRLNLMLTLALVATNAQGAVPTPDMMDPSSTFYQNHMAEPVPVIIPPTPVSDERCVRELKTAKRKGMWAAIGWGLLGSAGNAAAATSTSTVRYRDADGYRATATATHYSPYIKAQLDAQNRDVFKGVQGETIEKHMIQAGCDRI